MLIFKNLSVERKKEIINYIIKNENESSKIIALRFNISQAKVNMLKKRYVKTNQLLPY